MASWEEMAEQVLVLGRPGDVRGAAQGWDQLLRACDDAKANLEQNVKDLSQGWQGPAYESFKAYITAIAKQLGQMTAETRADDGIVRALDNAADELESAQQKMPVPAVCTADVIAARNAQADIPIGFFTVKLKSNLLHAISGNEFARTEYKLIDWISNREGEARTVYNDVDGKFQDQTYRTPQSAGTAYSQDARTSITNPTVSGGGGGAADVGKLPGGGLPSSSAFGGPSTGHVPGIGTSSGSIPRLGGGIGFDPNLGSGLAGAGGLSGAGLDTGGLGGTGLGGTGLSGAGGGLGGLSGGGAAGKAVMPSMAGLMGAGAAAGLAGGGASAGARSARGTMAGGGHGAGHGGSEDERTTWLQEDEDPWGGDSAAPPGVLR